MLHTQARTSSTPAEFTHRLIHRNEQEMTMAVAQMTVGEIASHVPASLRVFERFNIDYCCGGGKSLLRACRESGVAADQVLSEIEEAQSTSPEDERIDWTEVPISD